MRYVVAFLLVFIIAAQAQTPITVVTPPGGSGSVAPLYSVTYSAGDTLNIPVCIGTPTMDTGSVWSATVPAGQIVWDSAGGPTAYSTGASEVMDLTGQQAPVQGGSMTLTNLPVLLSNSVRKGWVP